MSRAAPRFRRTNATLPPIGVGQHVIRFTVAGTLQGQTTLNTFYYRDTSVAIPGGFEGLFVTAWQAANQALYLGMCSQDFALDGFSITHLNGSTRPTVTVPVGAAAPGTVASPALDSMLSGVYDRSTLIKSACGRGRIAVPAVPVSFVAPGSSFLNGVGVAAYALGRPIFTNVIAPGGGNWFPCVYSRGTRVAPGVIGIADVVLAEFELTLGTTRRRKLGRGF